jgi:hypothetical protein
MEFEGVHVWGHYFAIGIKWFRRLFSTKQKI